MLVALGSFCLKLPDAAFLGLANLSSICLKSLFFLKENKDFVKEVFYECLRGHYKFGENIGRADYLLITEKKSDTIIDIFSLGNFNEKVSDYCEKCIDIAKKPLAIKSSRPGKDKPYSIWVRFL